MKSDVFHACKGMMQLTNPPPYFYVHEDALDTATGETFRAVMLAIAGTYSYVACQVDFCPWCGTQLTAYTRERSAVIVDEKQQYLEYRKRHMRSGQLEPPVNQEGFANIAHEYNETMMLISHAKPEHRPTLETRLAVLAHRLALGETTVAEPPEA